MATMTTLTCTTAGMGGFYGLCVEGDEVIAAGTNGLVVRSRDRGTTWTRLSIGKRWSLGGVARLTSGEIVIAAGGGRVVTSVDDGVTWTVAQLQHKEPLHQIAEGRDVVVVAGCNRVAWRVGGAWQERALPRGTWTRGVCFVAGGHAVITVSDGRVFRLDVNESRLELIAQFDVSALHAPFCDGDAVVLVGSAGFAAVSTDGGATWVKRAATTALSLTGGALVGSTVVVGTTRGGVLRSDDRATTWTTCVAEGAGPSRVHRLVFTADGGCFTVSEDGVFRASLAPAVR